jgi:pimeloyl-ACP methyl ester carboxylesterase
MQTEIVTLNSGTRIFVQKTGPQDAPPMLLLHGYPSNGHLWRHCIPQLSEGHRLYIPDLPGYGRSDKPLDAPYDLDYFSTFIETLLNAMQVKRVILVAHDLGAMAALGFAADHPTRISRMIILDTLPYRDWPLQLKWLLRFIQLPFVADLCLWAPLFKLMLRYYLVYDPAVITDHVVDLYRRPWIADRRSRKAYAAVVKAPPEKITLPLERLRSIATPTLILWARRDRVLPASIARRLQADLRQAELQMLEGCGHFLQEEKGQQIAARMLAFLSTSSR